MSMSPRAGAASAPRDRYSTVAIAFHWIIAAAIVLQILVGWRTENVTDVVARSSILHIHESVGICILLLTAGRLGWRLVNPPPPHGSNLTGLERRLAHWVHIGFYFALFALPLTGWLMVSTKLSGGMKLFGLVPWPQVPLLSLLPATWQETLSEVFDGAHGYLVWATLALLALHVAGALKHHFISRDPTVSRMAPGLAPGALADPRLLAIPLAIAVLAALAYLPTLPQTPVRPKITNLAKADIYLDIVSPALDRRCGACHNDDDAKGGLSLVGYDAILRGGLHGAALVPGAPAKSELYRRITLPHDNDKYMPKDGKPALSSNQVAVIGWWISQGAPASAQVASLKMTPQAALALQQIVRGSGDSGQTGGLPPVISEEFTNLPVVPVADAKLIARLENNGFVVRRIDKQLNLLEADYTVQRPITDADLALLTQIAPQLLSLNLRSAQITDTQMKSLAAMKNLRRLRLENNPITNAGLAEISSLTALRYLNLIGSKITDGALPTLAALPKLHELYTWQTAVTDAGLQQFRAAHKDIQVNPGLKPTDVVKDTRFLPVV